jgi:mono/diheme cytochrome c family protein
MNTNPLVTFTTLGAVGLAIASALPLPPSQAVAGPADAPAAVAPASQVERGKYLVTLMVCNDCHTPFTMTPRGPEPDMSRMLSGHPQDAPVTRPAALGEAPWEWAGSGDMTAFSGSWGVSFTANLTPDPETGLGKWAPETFIAAIRNGRHEGQGRPLLPPMPWPWYRNATDDDLRAIFAYLQSIPPVKNRVPQPIDPPEVPEVPEAPEAQ